MRSFGAHADAVVVGVVVVDGDDDVPMTTKVTKPFKSELKNEIYILESSGTAITRLFRSRTKPSNTRRSWRPANTRRSWRPASNVASEAQRSVHSCAPFALFGEGSQQAGAGDEASANQAAIAEKGDGGLLRIGQLSAKLFG